MTTLALSRGGTNLLLGGGSRAHGDESRVLYTAVRELLKDRQRAASTPQSVAHALLTQLGAECSASGWDGYQAKPLVPSTIRYARLLLDALPTWTPTPDLIPEPDGEIAFEWDSGSGRMLSISIGPTGVLSFAGLFGPGVERHGMEPFSGAPSSELLSYIQRVQGLDAAA